MKFSNLSKICTVRRHSRMRGAGPDFHNCRCTSQPVGYYGFASPRCFNETCIVSAASLGFGNYTGAVVNANSTYTVTCTNGTTYTVGLNQGLTTGATVTTRQMGITQPAGGLNYSLLTGSYAGSNWGNTSGSWVSGTGSGAAQPLTVYGVLPAGQYVPPGSYTDTIAVTVTY